ncbi:hypothetical protein EPUS_06296 [Endocarpon pusillum Z07020]|uniref:Uncharacterized protein n=1 Tax=Endocarpon pusillum (strain Z07020 / HMAS-L-300199) TaxID=1263415 RepID=U1GX41_ENDPU|nr:uncharacterized protein EPUS_06296 [Endocarpon pusillum Z07020]ERF77078.1 hypothetical protein EPUS_06296 [Endocarpon pusillum Z07020]
MPVVHADLPGDVPQPKERTVLTHSHHQPAMSKPQMVREYFEHCLTALRTYFHQIETRSEELASTSNENKILKAENERLRAENRNLKENATKESAELAVLEGDKGKSKMAVEDLTVKLNKARSRHRHYRREAGELERSKVGALEDKVGGLESKIGGLEAEASKLKRVNRDLQRRYKVMLPLTWAACQIRLGRLETIARFWIDGRIHKPNDNIIRWRNSIAHDGNVTLDLAAVNFMEIYPNLDGGLHHFDDFKSSLDQHKILMRRQFAYGILKVTKLIENKNVMELLTARGTIWGNKVISSSVRSDFLVKTFELLIKYETAASEKISLDPFHENGPLAAELEEIRTKAKEVLARY